MNFDLHRNLAERLAHTNRLLEFLPHKSNFLIPRQVESMLFFNEKASDSGRVCRES